MFFKSKSPIKALIGPIPNNFTSNTEESCRSIKTKQFSGALGSVIKRNENLEVIKRMFAGLEQEIDGTVAGDKVVAKFFSYQDSIEKLSLEKVLCEYFLQGDICGIRMNPEDFFAIFFSNKKDDKCIQCLRINLQPRRMNSVFPGINQNSHRSSRLKHMNSHAFTHIEDNSIQEYFKLLTQWWEILSKNQPMVKISEFSEFLCNKGFSQDKSEAEALCSNDFNCLNKIEFFKIFIVGIIKSQIIELGRKINLQKVSRTFLPYTKMCGLKRRIMIPRLTPDLIRRSDDLKPTKKEKSKPMIRSLILNYF